MILKSNFLMKTTHIFAFSCFVCVSINAQAVEPNVTEPAGLNLGVTSYLDGFVGEPGKLYYIGYFRYQHTNAIKDKAGNSIPAFDDPRINVYTLITQFAYTSEKRVFGTAHLGADIIVPFVVFDNNFRQPGASLSDHGSGFGDLTFGPYLYFDPIKNAKGRPVFVNRVEFDVIAPTGSYNPRDDLNPGANTTSLNPFYAATWLPTPKITASLRAYYLYNFDNESPASSRRPLTFEGNPVRSTRAGQAGWLNFTMAYKVAPKISLGVNGYYFKQFTNDQINDQEISGSNEQTLGIGPGGYWKYSKKNLFMLNVYTETAVENRPYSPVILNARWIHEF